MNEERFVEIETKVAFQEQSIKDLNDVLYEQQQEIDRLSSMCDMLMNQYKDLSELTSGMDAPANEKPPHY